jgi:hypothetical protein
MDNAAYIWKYSEMTQLLFEMSKAPKTMADILNSYNKYIIKCTNEFIWLIL